MFLETVVTAGQNGPAQQRQLQTEADKLSIRLLSVTHQASAAAASPRESQWVPLVEAALKSLV
jgi:hypothetical protein